MNKNYRIILDIGSPPGGDLNMATLDRYYMLVLIFNFLLRQRDVCVADSSV